MTMEVLGVRLNITRCGRLFTPGRHSCSNEQEENCMETLEGAITVSQYPIFHKLDKCVDNFSFQYLNSCHSNA